MSDLKRKNHEIPCGKRGLQLLPLYVERLEHRGMQGRVRRYVPALLGQMERAGGKSIYGAAERFYMELSEDNRRLLAKRAVLICDE